MAYTVVDIIDKIINVIENKIKMCSNCLEKSKKDTKNYLLIKVLNKDLGKNILYYEELKKEISTINIEEIDFVIYDKIAFLINEFNGKPVPVNSIDAKNTINSCVDFQKNVLALYISIQGRLVKNEKDIKTKAYEILCVMIEEKKNDIEELKQFSKKYF